MLRNRLRDYDRILPLIAEGSRVLDLGCGNGQLLERLIRERNVRGMGVEIDENSVIECIRRGLSVFQGNIDEGLADYADASYDYVILNQTLQVIHRPGLVIEEMLRVGKKAIISFPNFGYWRVRMQLLLTGSMPRTLKLPFEWHNTPNIHLLTIRDFHEFCRHRRIRILRMLNMRAGSNGAREVRAFPNWLADEGLFVIAREQA